MKKPQKQHRHISLKVELTAKIRNHTYSDPHSGVFFPYQPYPSQLKIIDSISHCLQTSSNALIESPTGTGKTLCLLTGCLSYFYRTRTPAKIYYLTRTHSQINQIISELKKTSYIFNTTIIGSRELMCVNNSLRAVKGKQLDRKCEEYCSKGICRYATFDKRVQLPLLDLRELKEMGTKEGFCPYYYSRQKEEESELVILPYNYFLSYNLLSHNSFNIKDSVIVFDEAHNIDQIGQEGCSMALHEDLVSKAIDNTDHLIRSFEGWSEKKKSSKVKEIENTFCVRRFLGNLLASLRNNQKMTFKTFKELTIYLNNLTECKKETKDPIHSDGPNQKLNMYTNSPSLKDLSARGQGLPMLMKHDNIPYNSLEEALSILRDMTSIMEQCEDKYYDISITEEQSKHKLQLLCLSASVIFSRIKERKPKSVILASGTLQPFNYWEQEIGLKFSTQLDNQSFITRKHLYSQVIPCYKDHEFDFSYLKRANEDQLTVLLKLINDVASIVPEGVVVAFSSYELMERMLQLFTPDLFGKKLFWESKDSLTEDLIKDYEKATLTTGAILFMIMRGKLAEGIDFHDHLCRAIVVVGIPFSPLNDPRLEAKRRFLSTLSDSKISYEEWYMIQAVRVVSQAIGRVIRHSNDYGCVFLVDKKYERNQIRNYMPEWLIKCLRPSFSMKGVENFMGRKFEGESQSTEVGFVNAKKLLIFDETEEKEDEENQITTKKASKRLEIDETASNTHTTLNIEALEPDYEVPIFPQKQFLKRKQLGDIKFKRVIDKHQT